MSPISDESEAERETINLLVDPQVAEVDALLNRFSALHNIQRIFTLRFGSRVKRPYKTCGRVFNEYMQVAAEA